MRLGSAAWTMTRSGFAPGLGYVGPGPYSRRRKGVKPAPAPKALGGLQDEIVKLAKGGVSEVTDQGRQIVKRLDQAAILLKVSTGAAVLSALIALSRRR